MKTELFEKIPVGRAQDITNQQFGRLKALYRTINKGKKTAWVCECSCGQQIVVSADNLLRGHTQSCGCYQKEQTKKSNASQIQGQKFHKLTALERVNNPNANANDRNTYWLCECECGNFTITSAKYLTSGHTKSCGCLRGDNLANDLTNQQFGLLTAIDVNYDETRNKGRRYWNCICECGNKTVVKAAHLISGAIQTCGCRSMSHGEIKIQTLLKDNQINFEKQKTFETCRNSVTNSLFRFDFFVDNKYLIEYNGIQHYQDRSEWGEDLVTIQQRDMEKIEWAHSNNIPIIIIPYTHYDKLTFDDLQLNSTKFLI